MYHEKAKVPWCISTNIEKSTFIDSNTLCNRLRWQLRKKSLSIRLCSVPFRDSNNWFNTINIFAHVLAYLLTLPLCAGVSRLRALSPAWTESPVRETLISCTHLFLPHDLPPTKKSSTIKSWPTFCDQYFWKFPIWNSHTDEKCREIRMVKVFKWYPVIDQFDTFTGKLGHGD